TGAPRFLDELLENEMRSFRPFVLQYAVQRIQPLACFLRIVIRKCRHGLPLMRWLLLFSRDSSVCDAVPIPKKIIAPQAGGSGPPHGVALRHLAAGGMRPIR